MARTIATKYLAILAFGTLCVLLGSIIGGIGAFRSVMADPAEDGPITTSQQATASTAVPLGGVPTTTVSAAQNFRHYIAVVAYFPEVFDCDNLRDLYQLSTTDEELLGGPFTTSAVANNEDVRAATTDFCWRQSGRQAWLYALFLPILIIFLVLALVAAFRKSGYQSAIAGVGLSAFMLAYCAIVLSHYQSTSNIPFILDAFGDCADFESDQTVLFGSYYPTSYTATTNLALREGNRYNLIRGNTNQFDEGTSALNTPARLFGATPRRSFLCEDDWDYDNRFLLTTNYLYGGVALTAFGLLFVLIAFAYIAFPFLKAVPARGANQAQKNAYLTRNIESPDSYSYSYSD